MTYTPLTEFTIQPSITNMEEAHEYICNAVISLENNFRDDFLMSLHELLINSYRELEQNSIVDGNIIIELARCGDQDIAILSDNGGGISSQKIRDFHMADIMDEGGRGLEIVKFLMTSFNFCIGIDRRQYFIITK